MITSEQALYSYFGLIMVISLWYLVKEEFLSEEWKILNFFEVWFLLALCVISFGFILYCNNIYWSVFALELQSFLIFGSCALLSTNNLLKVIESSLSYLIPAFFSFFLMLSSICIIEIHREFWGLGNFLLLSAVMVKMGVIPFSFWVNNVMKNLTFNSIILLTFINKLSVLLILIMYFSHLWYVLGLCGIGSIIFGSFLMVNTPKTKEMIAYSSIINSGWLSLLVATFSRFTVELENNKAILGLFYFTYILSILVFINTNQNKSPFLKDINNSTQVKKSSIMGNSLTYASLLSMSGMPPYAGFIIKYLVLIQVIGLFSFQLAMVIITLSILATFCYIRPIISFSYPEVYKLTNPHLLYPPKKHKTGTNTLIIISFNTILLITAVFLITQ